MSDGRLDIESLRDYLRVHNWVLVESNSNRSIWSERRSEVRVFVANTEQVDFEGLADLAIQHIAEVEDRSESDVRLDISWAGWDKFSARRETATASLPMSEAVDMHVALSDLIVAGARASIEKRRIFSGGRRPAQIVRYLDRVRILPSTPGSFVARALLPLSTDLNNSLPLIGPAQSTVRLIATTMMVASKTAVSVAERFARGEVDLTAWDDAVAVGVSANLCDALARLCGYGEERFSSNCNLTVDWTWSAPDQAELSSVDISAGLAGTLALGSQYLQSDTEESSIWITGLITRLHRDSAIGPGEITIKGYIEGLDSGPRSLKVELDEGTYHEAVAAHDNGHTVSLGATVRRTARSLDVIRVNTFQVTTTE